MSSSNTERHPANAPGTDYGSQHSQEIHVNSDLNQGPEAQHHTLGKGADQAAPGNHTHALMPNNILSLPPASNSLQGQLRTIPGTISTADVLYVCLKAADNSYSWKVVATG
jgi:hypothetical protein